jgi:hypothetical protein
MTAKNSPQSVGLPTVTFLYTIDQIAAMVGHEYNSFVGRFVFFHLRNTRPKRPDEMLARNIAKPGDPPDWRIPQAEFVRWLRFKGFKVIPGGAVL